MAMSFLVLPTKNQKVIVMNKDKTKIVMILCTAAFWVAFGFYLGVR